MLELTMKYRLEYSARYQETWFNPKYMYYNYRDYYNEPSINDSTYEMHDFVSVFDGKVLGNIHYQINRSTRNVCGLGIICFEEKPSIIFGRDVLRAVTDIFEKFRFRKLGCSVITANPIMKTYDRFITQHGGRICGVEHEETMLFDGLYYDVKHYEILAKDWFDAKIKKCVAGG